MLLNDVWSQFDTSISMLQKQPTTTIIEILQKTDDLVTIY